MGAAPLIDFPSRQIKDEEEPEYDTAPRPEPTPRHCAFVIVPDQVRRLAAARRDPLMAQVYLTIAAHANRDGVCWPSQSRIATEAGISERKVRSAITAFCEAGIVSIERRGRINIYRLTAADAIPDIDYDANCRHDVPVSNANNGDQYRHQSTSRRHVGTLQRHVTTAILAPRAAKLDTRTTPKNKKTVPSKTEAPKPANRVYEIAAWYADHVGGVIPGKGAREWSDAKRLAATPITIPELSELFDWLAGQAWVESVSLGLMASKYNEWRSSQRLTGPPPKPPEEQRYDRWTRHLIDEVKRIRRELANADGEYVIWGYKQQMAEVEAQLAALGIQASEVA